MTLLIFILLYVSAINSQSFYRYEVIVDHLELTKRDELMDSGTFRVTKYNRTSYVLTGYFEILKPFSDKLTAQFELFEYQGNEYRKLFEKKVQQMCSAFRNDVLFIPKLIEKTSLAPEIKSCPIEPQRVHFYDASLPNDYLPVQPPKGEKYRLDFTYFSDDHPISNFSVYFLLKKIDDGGIPKVPKAG